jgi:type II secretion system protein N
VSDRAKKILLYGVGYPFFFLFSLILGAYWTFPYDHVRDFIVQEAERGGAMQLEITRLEPSWVTGVEMEGVRVATVPEDASGPPQEVLIREATARVGLLALMGGTTDVSFDAELDGGGTIEGAFSQSEEATHVEAELQRVDLRRIGPLRGAIGLPITGRAEGNIDLTVGTEAADTEGSARLTIRNLSVADGETPLEIEGLGSAGLTLEQLNLGTLQFELETERGAGRIEELHADGEDAELWGSGSIRLARPLSRSSLDMLVRLDFKEGYRTASPRMEGLFALLEVNPQVRPARTPDGAFQWRIQGAFSGRMRMTPAGRADMPGAD